MPVELKTALPPQFLSRTSLPEPAGLHVWRIDLGAPGAGLTDLFHELSSEERDRTGRFHFRPDAERFIAAHGTMRRILSSYTGVPPGDLEFARGPFGKPSLVNAGEKCAPLRFNMADSGTVALLAVARGCDVGVDIERITPGGALDDAAHRCFCDAEIALVLRAPRREDREDLFFRFWSRKEAYIKARGEGLSLPLKEIDVSAAPALIAGRWWLEDLTVDPEYRGAVVLDGRIRTIQNRTMPPGNEGGPV